MTFASGMALAFSLEIVGIYFFEKAQVALFTLNLLANAAFHLQLNQAVHLNSIFHG